MNVPKRRFAGLRCHLDKLRRSLRGASFRKGESHVRRYLLDRVSALRSLVEQAERHADDARQTYLREVAAGLRTLDRALARGVALGTIPEWLGVTTREAVQRARVTLRHYRSYLPPRATAPAVRPFQAAST